MTSKARKPIRQNSAQEIFAIFFRLGLTSFGGPVAHLGYFRTRFVKQLGWFDDSRYSYIVALCQFLPGPTSSQVGIAIGHSKAGIAGALAAWLGFTAPSALIMIACGYGMVTYSDLVPIGALHGLKIAAAAIVAHALAGMAKNLTPDLERIILAGICAFCVSVISHPAMQMALIISGGLYGVLRTVSFVALDAPVRMQSFSDLKADFGQPQITCLILFFGLLCALPLIATTLTSETLTLIDGFFRSGSMVFGGGHVVLPLLHTELVPRGLVSHETFLAGYGTAQAIPGPLFTFAAYLGTTIDGIAGGFICLIAIFIPSFLLVIGVLPVWEAIGAYPRMKHILWGVNASVVGLLLAAFISPVLTSAIQGLLDGFLAGALFFSLHLFNRSPVLIVSVAAIAGSLLPL